MLPGLRLRQVRKRLGLTYRDVEAASYELAAVRGSPSFIVHISQLADIENRNVVPGLHKFYTLAALYHLNPQELFRWFEIPIEECFADGINFQVPRTHAAAPPTGLRVPLRFDPGFDPRRTDFLSRIVERRGHFEGALKRERPQHVTAADGFSGIMGLAEASRGGRQGNWSVQPFERTVEFSACRISSSARRFEKKSSRR